VTAIQICAYIIVGVVAAWRSIHFVLGVSDTHQARLAFQVRKEQEVARKALQEQIEASSVTASAVESAPGELEVTF
jgi:hypothetical protein